MSNDTFYTTICEISINYKAYHTLIQAHTVTRFAVLILNKISIHGLMCENLVLFIDKCNLHLTLCMELKELVCFQRCVKPCKLLSVEYKVERVIDLKCLRLLYFGDIGQMANESEYFTITACNVVILEIWCATEKIYLAN